MTQPGHVRRACRIVISNDRIPEVVCPEILVECGPDRRGRVDVPRTDQESTRADGIEGLAGAIEIAFAGGSCSGEMTNIPCHRKRKALFALVIGLRWSRTSGKRQAHKGNTPLLKGRF